MPAPLTLGGFELTSRLRRGGMAEVWRGVHPLEGTEVAVKLVDVERAHTRRLREALQNEVRAMARLDHPGVVRVHDYGEVDTRVAEASNGAVAAASPYLVMELADGGPLTRDHVSGYEELTRALAAILEALAHAHARGVVHRDLKPSNVLVNGPEQRLLLSDFGISSALAREPRGAAAAPIPAGTAWFMAPEQILGLHRDEGPWTDLYSLGCVAYLLATGHPPFPGKDRERVYSAQCLSAPPRLEPRFDVPQGLEAWLAVLLEKRPRDRFPLAADALRALKGLSGPTLSGRPARLELTAAPTATMEKTPDVTSLPTASSSTTSSGTRGDTHKDETETAALLALSRFDVGSALDPSVRTAAQAMRAAVAPSFPPADPDEGAIARHLLGIGLGVYGLRAIPLAGRDAERAHLWAALEDVWRSGKPRAIQLYGRAGHGKTRIAEWLVERAHQRGSARVAWAALGPTPTPGEGLIRMWLRFLRGEGLKRHDLRERLAHHPTRRGLDDLGVGERHRLLEVLAPTAAQAHARAEERFAALLPLLTALSTIRPLVLVFDDVQVGREAIQFAAHLLKLRRRLPVLVLLTAREEALEERPLEASLLDDLLAHPRAERVEIGPLDDEHHARLIGSMLGLEHALASRIVERTAGNPLFAIQLVGDWVQRGMLAIGDDGFRLADGVEPPLPDDIYALWTERVERLLESVPASERDRLSTVLELAALLGRTVALPELVEASREASVELPEGLLDRLASRRLARVGRARFSFVHGLLSESLRRRAREQGRWAELHRACARALDRSLPPDAADERVGRHLADAGDASVAAPRLLAAASARLRLCDYAEAHALSQLADEGLTRASVAPSDPIRARGSALRAEASIKQGDVQNGQKFADQAALTDDPRVLAEVSRLRARAALKAGDHERAAERFAEALEQMQAVGDEPGEGASLHGLGEAERVTGKIESAIERFEQAAALFERLGNDLDAARARMGLGDTLRRRGELDRAVELIEAALVTTRRVGNPHGVAVCSNTLGDIARARGQLDEAERHYEECLRELDALASFEALIPRINLAFVQLARSRWSAARRTLEHEREVLQDKPGYLVYVLAALLACDAAEARWSELGPLLDRIEAILEDIALVDEDLAWCLAAAWREASAGGEGPRAERARELAFAQYRSLGQDGQARALETTDTSR